MQTIVSELDAAFRAAITAAFDIDADPLIGVSQNQTFGDYQSNVAMGLAKRVTEKTGQKANPRAVAEQIKSRLNLGEMAQDISIAGPGFINVRLAPAWLAQRLASVATDPRLGIDPSAQPQTVVVDYSGPNIAKQMHVGHLRSTIIGDAISRMLAFGGHNVIRQNHVGDWGTQFGRVVLAMWYAAMAEHFGQEEELLKLADEFRTASACNDSSGDALVHRIAELHRSWIKLDEEADEAFARYLEKDKLSLAELERTYQFISALTDHPAAAKEWIWHKKHGNRKLDELPRLVTTFIQNPDDKENKLEALAWTKAGRITMEACDRTYDRLGVQLANPSIQSEQMVRGESFYNDRLLTVVEELLAKGIAVRSEGAVVVMVPAFEAPLLIQKSDGSFLYGTTDLAAIRFRVKDLHANRVIYTHDSRQSQHFAQVFWTARQAGWAEKAELEYAPFGTMLGEDGKPFKTRSGDTVKLTELLVEAEKLAFAVVSEKNAELPESTRKAIARAVGIGAVKYADLSKDRVSDYVFSWDRMLAMDGNTAPYLQIQHARIKSIFRKGGGSAGGGARLSLEAPQELALAKHIARLGEIVGVAATELKPHHLTTYLYDLATKFSSFYTECPVLKSEEPTRSSRLLLCGLTARTLEIGLDLLGIEHPDEM
ncbi:MAG TPA: arginine--tRNA ligase [Tepidisphaeraceae bacterium]